MSAVWMDGLFDKGRSELVANVEMVRSDDAIKSGRENKTTYKFFTLNIHLFQNNANW